MKKETDSPAKKFWAKQRLLVIAPHPDDEVYGCAATMAKAKALGAEVYVMIFSVGDLKFYEKKNVVRASERIREVGKAAKLLGWDGYQVIFTDVQKHLRLDAIPRRDLIAQVERESIVSLERIRPTLVAIPAASYNQDHEAVYKASFTALRVHAGGHKTAVDQVMVYDHPTLYWSKAGEEFHPNFYVDIQDYLEIKKKAIRIYASQNRDRRDPCSLENMIDLAHIRGREVGRAACEAYAVCRMVV